MKLARAALVALLILFMAVTPLSALIAPGQFELTFADADLLSGRRLTVTFADRTGLVRSMAPAAATNSGAVTNFGTDGRTLIVSWGHGCGGYHTELVFERMGSGFVLSERTHEWGCGYMILVGHAVAIHLWAPVDASTVEFECSSRNWEQDCV